MIIDKTKPGFARFTDDVDGCVLVSDGSISGFAPGVTIMRLEEIAGLLGSPALPAAAQDHLSQLVDRDDVRAAADKRGIVLNQSRGNGR